MSNITRLNIFGGINTSTEEQSAAPGQLTEFTNAVVERPGSIAQAPGTNSEEYGTGGLSTMMSVWPGHNGALFSQQKKYNETGSANEEVSLFAMPGTSKAWSEISQRTGADVEIFARLGTLPDGHTRTSNYCFVDGALFFAVDKLSIAGITRRHLVAIYMDPDFNVVKKTEHIIQNQGDVSLLSTTKIKACRLRDGCFLVVTNHPGIIFADSTGAFSEDTNASVNPGVNEGSGIIDSFDVAAVDGMAIVAAVKLGKIAVARYNAATASSGTPDQTADYTVASLGVSSLCLSVAQSAHGGAALCFDQASVGLRYARISATSLTGTFALAPTLVTASAMHSVGSCPLKDSADSSQICDLIVSRSASAVGTHYGLSASVVNPSINDAKSISADAGIPILDIIGRPVSSPLYPASSGAAYILVRSKRALILRSLRRFGTSIGTADIAFMNIDQMEVDHVQEDDKLLGLVARGTRIDFVAHRFAAFSARDPIAYAVQTHADPCTVVDELSGSTIIFGADHAIMHNDSYERLQPFGTEVISPAANNVGSGNISAGTRLFCTSNTQRLINGFSTRGPVGPFASLTVGATHDVVGLIGGSTYRTTAGDTSTFYLLPGLIGSTSDGTNDTILQAQPRLYTNTGELPNFHPGPVSVAAFFRDRLIIVRNEDQGAIYASKPRVDGLMPEFSEFLRQYIGGNITALAQLDDKFVIFTRDSVCVVSGDGPSAFGQGRYSDPYYVSRSTGSETRLTVQTDDGIMFQSPNGVHILTRDLRIDNSIGDAMFRTRGERWQQVAHDKTRNIALIGSASRTMAYDTKQRIWAEWVTATTPVVWMYSDIDSVNKHGIFGKSAVATTVKLIPSVAAANISTGPNFSTRIATGYISPEGNAGRMLMGKVIVSCTRPSGAPDANATMRCYALFSNGFGLNDASQDISEINLLSAHNADTVGRFVLTFSFARTICSNVKLALEVRGVPWKGLKINSIDLEFTPLPGRARYREERRV